MGRCAPFQTTEPEEGPWGIISSASIQGTLSLVLPRSSAAKETNVRSPLQPHFPSWAVSRLSFPSGESPKAILHGQENQGGNDKDPTMKVNRKQSDLWLLGSCSAEVGVGRKG